MRRSDPEPRLVHNLPIQVDRESFYCAYCGEKFNSTTPGSPVGHVRSQHAVEDPTDGDDYVRGWQALLWRERHSQWRLRQEWRAELVMKSLVGVDDFLLECGDA